MERELGIVRTESQINYSYATIKLTQSRLDKGLIAVPVALAKRFPDHNADIQIYLDDSPTPQPKRYSSYSSTTKECRIGGVRQWCAENNLRTGDEIVVQFIDEKRFIYRLIPERDFVTATRRLQTSFDDSSDDLEASETLSRLSVWTNTGQEGVVLNEYRRLAAACVPTARGSATRRLSKHRESTPPSLRTLLGRLYRGHCQVCDFWFLKRDNGPYFEVHHLNAQRGHHPKNLVVVCGNCHNQFEFADVSPEFDGEQWLIGVCFNKTSYHVNQIVLSAEMPSFSKELFL